MQAPPSGDQPLHTAKIRWLQHILEDVQAGWRPLNESNQFLAVYPSWQHQKAIRAIASQYQIPPIVLAGALNHQAAGNRYHDPLFLMWFAAFGQEPLQAHSYGIAQLKAYEVPILLGEDDLGRTIYEYSWLVKFLSLCSLSLDDKFSIDLMARKLAIAQQHYLAGSCGADGCSLGEYNLGDLYAILGIAQNDPPGSTASLLTREDLRDVLTNPRDEEHGHYWQLASMYSHYVILSENGWELSPGVADYILQLLQQTNPNP